MTDQHTVFALTVANKTAKTQKKESSRSSGDQLRRYPSVEIIHIKDERPKLAPTSVEESIKIQERIEDKHPHVIREKLITMESDRGSMIVVALEQEPDVEQRLRTMSASQSEPEFLQTDEVPSYNKCRPKDLPIAVEETCNQVVLEEVEALSTNSFDKLELEPSSEEQKTQKPNLSQESPDQESHPLLITEKKPQSNYHKNAINGSTAKGISIPEHVMKEKVHSPLSKTRSDSRKSRKALNVAVFLKEGQGKLLMLERGKSTSAGEIKEIMLDNLSLPRKLEGVFSVWLISPLLELQLKDHHIPFALRKQWKELLQKFATLKKEEIAQDEPVIVFQRNSFLPVHLEKKITDDRVVRRLFEEAKHNILMGRYPICRSDAIMLGGILCRIEHGQFDPDVHTHGFFKKTFSQYLPDRSCRHLWFGRRSASLESRLLEQYQRASECADDPKKCHRLFLEYCWSLPFYGCAFFKGEVEQPSTEYKPWRSATKTVHVGINRFGITIFQHDKQEILLSLSYDDLSWDYVPASEDETVDSFYLEFDARTDLGEVEAEQLQIISPQAVMMDAMVDSCVFELNRINAPKSPPVSPSSLDDKKFFSDARRRPLVRTRKNNFSLSNPFKVK